MRPIDTEVDCLAGITGPWIVVAAVIGALLACPAASPAATLPVLGGKAATGRLVSAPRQDAHLVGSSVRVAVRVPAGTTRLEVRVGERNATARFRRTGGSRRVAVLSPGSGVHPGRNRVFVVARRGSRRPLVQARTFYLLRRRNGLAHLRVKSGGVISASLRLAGPVRRLRTVRFRLNGRPVTRAARRPGPRRWTESLSATHGLHYGVNRLRVRVVEPGAGRYALLRRRFRVRRGRPLAAAGWDKPTRVGGRVRLNAGRSRSFRRGRLRYRWNVVAAPRGAHVALRHRGRVRAAFVPHRPGHYVVRLKVRHGRRGSRAGTDNVGVTVAPSQVLMPFIGITHQGSQPGIQVGGTFYPNPSPNGTAMQWLTLDRATLKPIKTGNSWLDGSGSGDHGVGALSSALSGDGLDQLVILSYPYEGPAPPVQSDQNDAFNAAMKLLGVGPISARILQDHNKLAIVGVPYGGPGSGWYTHGGANVDGLKGWLMPDATTEPSTGAARYRFQPERIPFDTSTSSTPTTNTMTLRAQGLNAALPAGATGGFEVVRVNPIDFTPAGTPQVFATNGVSDPVTPLNAMATYINATAGPDFDVAVQSIGHVKIPDPPSDPYAPDTGGDAWRSVASALGGYGANPDTFNQVDGSYAFLGGANLDRDQVAESSSATVVDPTTTPPEQETGTLSGRARMGPDGYIVPAVADTSNSLDFALYDYVFRAPTPWPYTTAAGDPHAAQYAKALADITAALPDLKSYAPDLRQAYLGNDNITYSDSLAVLINMPYPGDGTRCKAKAGVQRHNPGYTRQQFCNLSSELQSEFQELDATQTLFDSYEKALSRTGGNEVVDLQSLGETIRADVAPPPGADITGRALAFIAAILGFGGPETAAAGKAINFLATAYELGQAIASDANGQPVGDQINTQVIQLSQQLGDNLSASANALDELRDVVISDAGRLKALGSVADSSSWHVKVASTTSRLSSAAYGWFSSRLMPTAYDAWYLSPTPFNNNPTVGNCYIIGYGHSFENAPASAHMVFHGGFSGAQGIENQLALGKHTWTATQDAGPQGTLTDPMFRPASQNGYGLRLPDFIWRSYKAPYPYVNCH